MVSKELERGILNCLDVNSKIVLLATCYYLKMKKKKTLHPSEVYELYYFLSKKIRKTESGVLSLVGVSRRFNLFMDSGLARFSNIREHKFRLNYDVDELIEVLSKDPLFSEMDISTIVDEYKERVQSVVECAS